MKAIAKLAVPAAFAVAAFGVQAQTIETDYPQVRGAGTVVAAVQAPPSTAARSQAPLYLVQSNFEGPKADPAQIVQSAQSRADVRAEADVNVRWTPADMRGRDDRS